MTTQKNPAILALSSRPWLNYTFQNLMHFTPLIFENLDYAWSFSAELCPEGLIGISGSVLRQVPLFILLCGRLCWFRLWVSVVSARLVLSMSVSVYVCRDEN